jgi:hypothetical protein
MVTEAMIRVVARNTLPQGMELYETDGCCFFKLKVGGELSPNKVFYLIKKVGGLWYNWGVELTPADSQSDLRRKIILAISEFQAAIDLGRAEKADDRIH